MESNKPTGRVEARGVKQVEERERGVEPRGTGVVSPKIPKSLKLSLRGSVETSSTSAGSAEEAEDRIGCDRSVRPSTSTDTQTDAKEGRFGAETGRPLGKIFHREYILGVSVDAP